MLITIKEARGLINGVGNLIEDVIVSFDGQIAEHKVIFEKEKHYYQFFYEEGIVVKLFGNGNIEAKEVYPSQVTITVYD